MIFRGGSCHSSPIFEGKLHSEIGRHAMTTRIGGNHCIVDVSRVEIFPPDLIATLAQVPRDNSRPVVLERLGRLYAAAVDPVDIVTKSGSSAESVGDLEWKRV